MHSNAAFIQVKRFDAGPVGIMDKENNEPGDEERDAWLEKSADRIQQWRNQDDSLYPIDHSLIIDGFSELTTHKHYLPFDAACGICGTRYPVSSREQKYIVEMNGVPVKHLTRGAVFCEECLQRRVAIKGLSKHHQDKDTVAGKILLKKLIAEEEKLKYQKRQHDPEKCWPY